jgi:hypothetical protein
MVGGASNPRPTIYIYIYIYIYISFKKLAYMHGLGYKTNQNVFNACQQFQNLVGGRGLFNGKGSQHCTHIFQGLCTYIPMQAQILKHISMQVFSS